MITGRDLIIYILEHKLEDIPIAKDGEILGFWTAEFYAKEMGVGVETVKVWISTGIIEDCIPIGGTYLIPAQIETINELKEQLRKVGERE